MGCVYPGEAVTGDEKAQGAPDGSGDCCLLRLRGLLSISSTTHYFFLDFLSHIKVLEMFVLFRSISKTKN